VIEWKYLETYGANSVATSPRGTDRIAVYQALIEAATLRLHPAKPTGCSTTRTTSSCGRRCSRRARVTDPDVPETEWIHVHVIPKANVALRQRVKAVPLLLGETLEETWRSALKARERYRIITPSDAVAGAVPVEWLDWRGFLGERYLT
jgi:hypothetical protein